MSRRRRICEEPVGYEGDFCGLPSRHRGRHRGMESLRRQAAALREKRLHAKQTVRSDGPTDSTPQKGHSGDTEQHRAIEAVSPAPNPGNDETAGESLTEASTIVKPLVDEQTPTSEGVPELPVPQGMHLDTGKRFQPPGRMPDAEKVMVEITPGEYVEARDQAEYIRAHHQRWIARQTAILGAMVDRAAGLPNERKTQHAANILANLINEAIETKEEEAAETQRVLHLVRGEGDAG